MPWIRDLTTALADQPTWPRIRARPLEFIDIERLWAHSAARYAEVCGPLL